MKAFAAGTKNARTRFVLPWGQPRGAPRGAHRRLSRRLAFITLLPVTLGILLLAVFAERRAHSLLEDELGRRLALSAVGIALQVLPEQVIALTEGEENSRTFANVRHKLLSGQMRFGLRRVLVLAPDFTARGDSSGRLRLGAKAYEVTADEPEIRAALAGQPTASILFTGRDRLPYKRAYAAIGAPAVGVVMVEGNATYYEPLVRFRRWLFVWGGFLLLVLVVAVVVIGQRIVGPVGRLALAADRIGGGELSAPIAIETKDEIGLLAERFEQMRRALAARDERMQMMLAGIAHEVRNPLGGLELFVGLLREGLVDQPERLAEVASLQRELTYLNAVVSEFLDYARRPVLSLEELNVRDVLQDVVAAAGATRDVVQVNGAAGLLVKADAGQLRRALLNLLRNALQVAPQGPVVLAARQEKDHTIIEVRDAGPGVPAELQEKIFTPFFTTRQKGTGLGLAFAKEIVAEHHGSLTVHTAPEGGACFRITL
ncbi:MAG: HAMP domain-containing sensor histidine kinase [Deltaproteobacteria bacterium]|nr:HAMP domain-containing sensor histidine kinase [Deltaproteobacteria bacterium]